MTTRFFRRPNRYFPGKFDDWREISEAAGIVSGPVITRYRDSMQNLRSTFLKIIKRAGLKAWPKLWPKLFQNLRSTRETELAETLPLQAVTAWIGNSQLVAAKHYLQLRDEHFDRASAEDTHPTTKTPGEGHSQGHNACAAEENEKPTKAKNPAKLNVLRGSADEFVPLRERGMGAEGLEASADSKEKTSLIEVGGNTSGNIAVKIQFARVIFLFKGLDDKARNQVLAFAQAIHDDK